MCGIWGVGCVGMSGMHAGGVQVIVCMEGVPTLQMYSTIGVSQLCAIFPTHIPHPFPRYLEEELARRYRDAAPALLAVLQVGRGRCCR